MKINTFSRTMACGLVIAFFLMPINNVSADGYTNDSDYWRWWYIEHQTDAITDGQGSSAENITNTDSGQNAGTVIYNQSGVTRGDFIDYVEEQYNEVEGYVEKSVDYYVDAVNHVYDSTVTAGTKAAYETQKAVREVVDSTGKTIVDVSGSDFWHSAYNSLFNGNGYKDQYTQGVNDSVSGTNNGKSFTIQFLGTLTSKSDFINDTHVSPNYNQLTFMNCTYDSSCPSGYPVFKVTYDGVTYYKQGWTNIPNPYFLARTEYSNNTATFGFARNHDPTWIGYNFGFSLSGETSADVTSTPVLQPKQCGFIIYNGERLPVYIDPTQNPFTVNDDGTVEYNGNKYPIYIYEKEITPEGWLKILEYIDNQDQTENPYNPQGQPWNTKPDGTVLGGLFSSLISDIGNLFNNIGDIFKNLIEKLINAIKNLFNMDYDSLNSVELEVNFNVIQDIIDNLLEYLGVT